METSEPWVETPTASPSITVLPMTDKEKKKAKQREGRPFGFARALVEPEPWTVTVKVNGEPLGTWDKAVALSKETMPYHWGAGTLKSSTCTDSQGVIREVVPREVMKLRKGESIVITRVSDNDDALSVQVRHAKG